MTMSRQRFAAVVSDLFLATRIAETAKAAGAEVTVVKPEQAPSALRAEPPVRVFIDLEAAPDVAALIAALRREPALAGVELVGFYPHVRVELRERALAAGLDVALPRSAFTTRLPALMTGGIDRLSRPESSSLDPEGDPTMPETRPAETAPPKRVRISCPGCGRNDHVQWPEGQAVYHWKCFNCGKAFDLTRDGSH